HETERLVAVGERLFENSNHCTRPTAVIEGPGKIGLKFQRLIVIVDRVVVLALPELSVATIEIGFRRWHKFERLVVVLDGAVVLAFAVVADAAIVEGRGEFTVKLDRLAVVGDRAVVVPVEAVTDAATVEHFGKLVALLASRLDHRRAGIDALVRCGRVLALAPAPLLRRLRVRGRRD